MGCTHAPSPRHAHQCVELQGSPSTQGLQTHHSSFKVRQLVTERGCFVLISLQTAPPSTPTNVTAVQFGPSSAIVSWAAPTSGGPVTRYDMYVADRSILDAS